MENFTIGVLSSAKLRPEEIEVPCLKVQ